MRIDWYTKGVLTVIAVLLGVIAIRPYVSPDAVAHAQGSFAGVQFASSEGIHFSFFDSRTGEVWNYVNWKPMTSWRLHQLGQPMTPVK
jgi:hypothetical protein